jgi:hypothetical protein
LIATFMGRWNSRWFTGEHWDENRTGRNVLHHNRDWDSGGPAVLMSEWWVREHWGRAFEIVTIAPQFHNFSWAVMRKRDVELTDDDIDAPSGDPREYASVVHNVTQIQRELELIAAQHEQALADNERARADLEQRLHGLSLRIDEYENSLSWRVTRPLRGAAGALRSRVRRNATR